MAKDKNIYVSVYLEEDCEHKIHVEDSFEGAEVWLVDQVVIAGYIVRDGSMTYDDMYAKLKDLEMQFPFAADIYKSDESGDCYMV